MPTSLKSKSTRGENGPDAPRLELEDLKTKLTLPPASSNEKSITPDPVLASPPNPEAPVAEPAAESVNDPVTVSLSASDLKLARKMSKAIADSLGLSGKTRSVKI